MDNKTTIRVNKFALMGCSQSPHDVTTANLRLVKNVVEPQKFDQELRVSYKPTAFRRWVVDSISLRLVFRWVWYVVVQRGRPLSVDTVFCQVSFIAETNHGKH